MAMKDTSKPYILQEPADIAQRYGGDKRKIQQAAAMRVIDPTAAVLAGMFIDQMRSAAAAEQVPQQTVAQQTFAPPPPQMPMGGGLGATPQAQQMASPAQMPMNAGMQEQMPVNAAGGGLMSLPVSDSLYDSYAGGGIVAFAQGSDKPVRSGMTDEEARRLGYGSAEEYEAFTRMRGTNEGQTSPVPSAEMEVGVLPPEFSNSIDRGALQRQIEGEIPRGMPYMTGVNSIASGTNVFDNAGIKDTFLTQPAPGRPGPTPENLEILRREQGVLPTEVAPPVSDVYPDEMMRGSRAGLASLPVSDAPPERTRGITAREPAPAPDPAPAPAPADANVAQAAVAADPKAAEAAVKKDGIPGLAAYVNQFKDLIGTEQGEATREYKEYLKSLPGELDKRKKEDLWAAVTQFGFSLAGSQSPYFLQAAGQAGTQTMPALAAAMKDRRSAEAEARKARVDLEKMERAEQLKAIELGTQAYGKDLDRTAQITAANIAAGKPTDMRQYAQDVVAAQGGDKEAKMRVDAVNQYLSLYGAAGLRGSAAVAQAGTAEAKLGADVKDKARDNVDNSLAKNYNSPENKEIRRLQKLDKQNEKDGKPSNLAGDYTQGLYSAEERRIGGGTQPAPAPAPAPAPRGAAGTKDNPLSMPKSASEAQSGKVYMTGRGLATWNGKEFVPVK